MKNLSLIIVILLSSLISAFSDCNLAVQGRMKEARSTAKRLKVSKTLEGSKESQSFSRGNALAPQLKENKSNEHFPERCPIQFPMPLVE